VRTYLMNRRRTVTVSMRVMSAGDGYRYLLASVAAGDGERDLGTPLTQYYVQHGTPPGRWLGGGVQALDAGLQVGDVVSEVQLQRLLGQGCNPVTGVQLGRPYLRCATPRQKRATQEKHGKAAGAGDATSVQVGVQPAEAAKARRAVAGFDYTFSVPKSVSVLWGLADTGLQDLIMRAHHEAVAEVLGFMERQVACTRAGRNASQGAVARHDVTGLIATAFDHYDSRAGDPQLHTHVVVSNKVRTVFDGAWRALDSRPMHAATVALSELYNGVLMDKLTGWFGVGWDTRDKGRGRNRSWEIAGAPDELISEFSTRSNGITNEAERLIREYEERHGRRPSARAVIRMRQHATLTNRPAKQLRSLAAMTTDWRQRAANTISVDAALWAAGLLAAGPVAALRADDVPPEAVADLGARVIEVVSSKRSLWRKWNLHAEASRQVMGWRFATAADREAVLAAVVAAAEAGSIRLTPEEMLIPEGLRRSDGSSVFRPHDVTVFSSQALWDAEERLLALSRDTSGPTVPLEAVESVASMPVNGRALGADQVDALAAVVTSGRVVDVLVGPAGAGKTTALAALRNAWEAEHGPGSVTGLAPSAAAAAVLATDLGIETENTAKWLADHRRTGIGFVENGLVIVDEASLSGTTTLDQITSLSAKTGAKVLLVGDWAQPSAVDAGGAFSMLVADREGDAPELADVRRFHNDWEKTASLDLRHGEPAVIDTYTMQGRVTGGEGEPMVDAAYQAWLTDTRSGKSSLLIANTLDTVTALNRRARADRLITGQTSGGNTVTLCDGLEASKGDVLSPAAMIAVWWLGVPGLCVTVTVGRSRRFMPTGLCHCAVPVTGGVAVSLCPQPMWLSILILVFLSQRIVPKA